MYGNDHSSPENSLCRNRLVHRGICFQVRPEPQHNNYDHRYRSSYLKSRKLCDSFSDPRQEITLCQFRDWILHVLLIYRSSVDFSFLIKRYLIKSLLKVSVSSKSNRIIREQAYYISFRKFVKNELTITYFYSVIELLPCKRISLLSKFK